MANNLDDFIKAKLDGQQREFELKDAYWMDAVKLIEEDEKKKKRPIFFWLFAAGILLLLSVGLGTYWYTQSTTTDKPTTQKAITQPIAKEENKSTTKTPATAAVTDNNTATNKADNKQNKLKTDTPKKSTLAENKLKTEDHTTAKSTQNTVSKSTDNSTTNSSTIASTTTDYSTNASTYDTYRPTTTEPKITTNNTIIPTTPSNTDMQATNIPATTNSTTTNNSISQSDAEPITDKINFEADRKPNLRTALDPTTSLESIWQDLPKPTASVTADDTPQIEELAELDVPEPVESPSIKRFSVGVRGSTLLYLSPTDVSKNYLGATAGLTFNYRLSRNWSLNADALYHIRKYEFSSVGNAEIVTYGFGRLASQQALTPTAIHSIEVPIYAEVTLGNASNKDLTSPAADRYNKHSIEFGLAPVFQYGVRGALIDAETNTAIEEGWIETSAYRDPRFNALVGYNFYLRKYLVLGLRARYAINGIIDEAYDTPAGMELTQPGNFYLGINVKCYLFRF